MGAPPPSEPPIGIWPGIGAWLFSKRPERAVEQVRIAREAGAAGDALFSWDAIVDAPALRRALVAEVASRSAAPPPGDHVEATRAE